jgi:hypothetical protein
MALTRVLHLQFQGISTFSTNIDPETGSYSVLWCKGEEAHTQLSMLEAHNLNHSLSNGRMKTAVLWAVKRCSMEKTRRLGQHIAFICRIEEYAYKEPAEAGGKLKICVICVSETLSFLRTVLEDHTLQPQLWDTQIQRISCPATEITNLWWTHLSTSSPEDGNRSSFRNVAFCSEYYMINKIQEPSIRESKIL